MHFYSSMPSLEEAALTRTAISLWNQEDRARFHVLLILRGRRYGRALLLRNRESEWLEVEKKVLDKVPELPLPAPLREKVSGLIKPIGLEILKWRKYHEHFLSDSIDGGTLIKLCWTSRGTVDKKKTAKALVRDENLEITKRYKLACLYCLEDDVIEIWASMSQREKAVFFTGEYPNFSNEHKLVLFWTFYAQEGIAKLNYFLSKTEGQEISPYEFGLKYAADDGNKVAFEYFLPKLTPQERERSVIKYAEDITKEICPNSNCLCDDYLTDYADLLLFLLSQMDDKQQGKMIVENAYVVLHSLLEWPWQGFFLEAANLVQLWLDSDLFAALMSVLEALHGTSFKDRIKNG